MKKIAVMLYLKKQEQYCFLVRDKANDDVHRQGILLSMGGKVEEGESLLSAIKREAQEESGVTVHSAELRAVLHFPTFGTSRHDWASFLFVSEDYSGEPVAGNEGSFVWHTLSEVPNLNFYEQDKIFLKLLSMHQFFVAEFICDGHEMVEYSVLKAL